MATPLSTRISKVLQAGQNISVTIPWQVFANTGNGPAAGPSTATYTVAIPAAAAGGASDRLANLCDQLDLLVNEGLATVS